MRLHALSATILCCLAVAGVFSSAEALTQDEILARLQSAGYSQIRPAPSGKIKSFRAVKDGRDVSVIVDSTGHIQEIR
jgi:hypothetical protein